MECLFIDNCSYLLFVDVFCASFRADIRIVTDFKTNETSFIRVLYYVCVCACERVSLFVCLCINLCSNDHHGTDSGAFDIGQAK